MDCRVNYIDMISAAGEVQHTKSRKIYIGDKEVYTGLELCPGDYFFEPISQAICIRGQTCDVFIKMIEYKVPTQLWLPTQAQLQELVSDTVLGKFGRVDSLVHKFSKYISSFEFDCKEMGLSMEQLWLMFTMKSLYDKEWNGEEWN